MHNKTNNKIVPYVSPYKLIMVFQQAVCVSCQNMIMVQNRIQTFDNQQDLEAFALQSHNAIVRETKVICVTPELKIFFGYALELNTPPKTF